MRGYDFREGQEGLPGLAMQVAPARDQGKVQQARELLAPVYGWFTEGASRITLRSRSACTNVWYIAPSAISQPRRALTRT